MYNQVYSISKTFQYRTVCVLVWCKMLWWSSYLYLLVSNQETTTFLSVSVWSSAVLAKGIYNAHTCTCIHVCIHRFIFFPKIHVHMEMYAQILTLLIKCALVYRNIEHPLPVAACLSTWTDGCCELVKARTHCLNSCLVLALCHDWRELIRTARSAISLMIYEVLQCATLMFSIKLSFIVA